MTQAFQSLMHLTERTGVSISAHQALRTAPIEVLEISVWNRPNIKRLIGRNADDEIVDTDGFDLLPLSARFDKFGELYADL